jgi:hypothetical protein
MILHHVETIVAAIGPTGVAFHIHHIVAAFHNMKVKSAQPSIAKVSRHDGPYCALTRSSGTNPTNIVMQLAPSHGMDRSTAEAMAKANFDWNENLRLNCIIVQR